MPQDDMPESESRYRPSAIQVARAFGRWVSAGILGIVWCCAAVAAVAAGLLAFRAIWWLFQLAQKALGQ